MDLETVPQPVERFWRELPHFPDGRIDYSGAKEAAVITVYVRHHGELLLLKRSDKVSTYQGKWNTVAGYLDELKPVEDKVYTELREEIGVGRELVESLRIGEMQTLPDQGVGKTWLIYLALADLKERPEIWLDWEHTEFRWIRPEELGEFDAVVGLWEGFQKMIA